MVQVFANLFVSAVAVIISAYLVPGVKVDSFVTALIVAFLMALVNTFVKPVLQLFALPLTILTLGLFALVINALMVLLVSYFVTGFEVSGFLPALIFSIVLSLITSVIHMLFRSS